MKKPDWILISDLKIGDVVEVQTRNTLYTMKVISPKWNKVRVNSNGRHITRETFASVVGIIAEDGTPLRGGIRIGYSSVLSVNNDDLVLSTTQGVRVNGVKVLPSMSD
ncbi:MAG: hypothetical protein HZB99_00330 [Candidatus Harrisonbacteria bacterium]|nr:hypothetical protein [Candidatus Harrisonbacteria bacterium]